MDPYLNHQLVKHRIAEQLEYAERMRRTRRAASDGPHPIDFRGLVGRARVRLAGFTTRGDGRTEPAGA